MLIYKITNDIDGKFYIGKTTKSITDRLCGHIKYRKSPKLVAAMDRHGLNHFTIEQIDSASTLEELNAKEIYWIKKLDALNKGYNLTAGGDGGAMTGEALEKIRVSAKNRKYSQSTRKKMSVNSAGHKNARAKKVVVTLENGIQIGFHCIKYASEYLGIYNCTGMALAQGIKAWSKDVSIEYVKV